MPGRTGPTSQPSPTPRAAQRYRLKDYTHYLKDDYGWLSPRKACVIFGTTADLGPIVSQAIGPCGQGALRQLAVNSVLFRCHHAGGAWAGEPAPHSDLDEILQPASVSNIHFKLSGSLGITAAEGLPPLRYDEDRALVLRVIRTGEALLG